MRARSGSSDAHTVSVLLGDGDDGVDETHLPLGREVTVTRGDTEEKGVKLGELADIGEDWVGWLWRGVHL